MRKTFVMLLVMIPLILILNKNVYASYTYPLPVTTHDFNKYVVFNDNTGTIFLYRTSNECTTDSMYPGKLTINSNVEKFYYNGTSWEFLVYAIAAGTATSYLEILEANYPIANYNPINALIISPDESNYEDIYPDINLTVNGILKCVIKLDIYEGGSWRNLKTWMDVPCENVSPHFASSNIPYGIGLHKVSVYNGATLLAEKQFTINWTAGSFAELTGVVQGQEYINQPTITVRKIDFDMPVTFYLNNIPIQRITAKTGSWYFTKDKLPDVVGSNTASLKFDSGVVLETITYTVLRSDGNFSGGSSGGAGGSGGGGALIDDTTGNPIDEAPKRTNYEDGILGSVAYGFDTIIYWIKYPFLILSNLLSDAVSSFGDVLGEVNGVVLFFKQLFSFLPYQMLTPLIAIFLLTCVFFVIKIVRN